MTINEENGKNYIGVTENTWKDRNYKHRNSYKDQNKTKNDTGLSKYIWDLKRKGVKMEDIFEWSMIDHATPYINGTRKCNLCLTEKFHIIKTSLELNNKRSELISKCHHENKFYLMNFKEGPFTNFNYHYISDDPKCALRFPVRRTSIINTYVANGLNICRNLFYLCEECSVICFILIVRHNP